MKDGIYELKSKVNARESELKFWNKSTVGNEKYFRRECLEISGIPGKISNGALKEIQFQVACVLMQNCFFHGLILLY